MSEQSQKTTGIRDARTLGIPKMLLLGIQHMFAMFGATILVPILTNVYFEGEGLSVQVTLICAGLGTLFFHLCSKMKVPAFLGSSFAFLGGFSAVAALDTGIFADMTMGEKLPYACGGIVVAGLLYLISCTDRKDRRCKKSNEIFASCCYRTNDHFNWSFTGRKCCY